MRALIISQPKAGTYLCANLLQEFGLKFKGLHLNEYQQQQYDLSNIYNSLINKDEYTATEHISTTVRRISDNHFAVTHLNYTDEFHSLFLPFKKIIITRPRNEIIESYKRFKEIRNGRSDFDTSILKQHYWLDYTNTFHLTFNNMINKDITGLDQLQEFLFGTVLHNSRKCIRDALTKDAHTKSSIR